MQLLTNLYYVFRNLRPGAPEFLPESYPDLSGKVVIVTGGNSGVGKEVVKLLYEKNATVYIFARNQENSLKAIDEISESVTSTGSIRFILVDLGDLSSIKPAAQAFLQMESKLHLVIHNAGVAFPPAGSTSAQGHELTLATNALGPYLLQKFLTPVMYETSLKSLPNEVRIVWLSSSASYALAPRNGVELNKMDDAYQARNYNYGTSKGMLHLMCLQWLKHHPQESSKILSLLVDPGNLKTNLARHLPKIVNKSFNLILYPAVYGAYTELFAALSPSLNTESHNAAYIVPWGCVGKMRSDIFESGNGSLGEDVWSWLETNTSEFS